MEREEKKKERGGPQSDADALLSLLDDGQKGFDPKALPAPPGVPQEAVAAVQGPEIDLSFHRYDYFAKKVESMPPIPTITMGFSNFDAIMQGGGRKGELIVVSALPKSGKTSWCQNVSYLQGLRGHASLWFSLEMSWEELTEKFMMTDNIYATSKVPGDFPIYYSMDNSGINVEKVRERVIEAKKQYAVDVVYIDHLHFLVELEAAGKVNTSFLMGDIVRRLKRMAVELNVLVVLIAHTKKVDLSASPDYNSIRDSSFISQEANFVIMLWRERKNTKKRDTEEEDAELEDEEVYTGKTVLSMELCRRGTNKKFYFGFQDGMFYPWLDYLSLKKTQDFFAEKRKVFETKNPYVAASSAYQEKIKKEERRKKEEEEARLKVERIRKEDEVFAKQSHIDLLDGIL